jgi:gluconate 2-dehydrogenase gamma chain
MERRVFLLRIGGLVAAGSVPLAWLPGCERGAPGAVGLPLQTLRTLAAVQSHLFPSEPGAPGAAEINALSYLGAMLRIPGFDPAERAAILNGAEEVERLARAKAGLSFVDLTESGREVVLRAFESTEAGRRWLAGMLGYLMEALLGDPVYGGNPNGIGWRWLEHDPGFPRPPAGKRYFLLSRP